MVKPSRFEAVALPALLLVLPLLWSASMFSGALTPHHVHGLPVWDAWQKMGFCGVLGLWLWMVARVGVLLACARQGKAAQ